MFQFILQFQLKDLRRTIFITKKNFFLNLNERMAREQYKIQHFT